MGAGKSTIAERLSKLLSSPHIDLDIYIENRENTTIREIFTTSGEEVFRKMEEIYIEEIVNSNAQQLLLLSLGGGSLMSDINRQTIKENTMCIYLKASIDTLLQRLLKSRKERPLISEMESADLRKRIESLLEKREEHYKNTATIVVNIDGLSVNKILEEILRLI